MWTELAFLAAISHSSNWSFSSPASSNITCLQAASTLPNLVDCFDAFTVSASFYSEETYSTAQPTPRELNAYTSVIFDMLNEDCSQVRIPDALSGHFSVSVFQDTSEGQSYCVFSETSTHPDGPFYAKGWGLFIVPARASRNIHISAPHPAYDLNTPQQAAALFQAVGARSLLIPGRARGAFQQTSRCVVAPEGDVYFTTDPAHDTVCFNCCYYLVLTRKLERTLLRRESCHSEMADCTRRVSKLQLCVHPIPRKGSFDMSSGSVFHYSRTRLVFSHSSLTLLTST